MKGPSASTYIIIGTEAMREPMQKICDRFIELMQSDSQDWLNEITSSKIRVVKLPTLDEVTRRCLLTKNLRTGTQTNYEKVMRIDFGDWLSKPVTQITRDMVEQRKSEMLSRKGKLTVNQSLCILRAILNFAGTHYETVHGTSLIAENPVRNLIRHSESNYRQNYIANDKLPDWYAALESVEWQTVRDYLLFVLLTGLRMREATSLKWSDVDFESRIIRLRAEVCKNKRGYSLPLSRYLLCFLNDRKLLCGESDFVFPGRANKGHLRSCQRAVEHIEKQTAIEFVLPDLRRTFIRAGLESNISSDVVRLLIDESASANNFGVLVSPNRDLLQAAMKKITIRLLSLLGVPNEQLQAST